MLERSRRAVRLVYLVARGVAHQLTVPSSPMTRMIFGTPVLYCAECNSMLSVNGSDEVEIIGTPPCPTHVAWREVARLGLPAARVSR